MLGGDWGGHRGHPTSGCPSPAPPAASAGSLSCLLGTQALGPILPSFRIVLRALVAPGPGERTHFVPGKRRLGGEALGAGGFCTAPGNGVMGKRGNVGGLAAPAPAVLGALGVLGVLGALGALVVLGVLGTLGAQGALGAQRRAPGQPRVPLAEPGPPELRCPRSFLHRERAPRTPAVSLSPTRAVRRPPSRVGDAVPRGVLPGPLRWGPRMRSEHPAPIPLPSLCHPAPIPGTKPGAPPGPGAL